MKYNIKKILKDDYKKMLATLSLLVAISIAIEFSDARFKISDAFKEEKTIDIIDNKYVRDFINGENLENYK